MAEVSKRVVVDELCRKHYLFEGKEVKLTGRIAKKQKRSGDNLMFEIRPLDASTATGSWRKWVLMSELYEIFDTSASRNVELAADLVDAIKRAVASKKKEDDGH